MKFSMRLTYNQHQFKDVLPEFVDINTGQSTLCLVCSIAKMMTDIRRVPYYPQTIVDLFRVNNGFDEDPSDGTKTIIKWSTFSDIWRDIYVVPLLWDRETKVHYNPSAIRLPSIVSVDGSMLIKGYQSHFAYVQNLIYKGNKIVNAEIFDPWRDRTLLVVPHYGDNLKDAIYSIINFVKS